MSRKRRNFSASFKAKVAIDAIKERETLTEQSKNMNSIPIKYQIGRKSF
jgi:HrpA-like RNA helicase